jgi:hypothetical protein
MTVFCLRRRSICGWEGVIPDKFALAAWPQPPSESVFCDGDYA